MGRMFNAAKLKMVPSLLMVTLLGSTAVISGEPDGLLTVRAAIEARRYAEADSHLIVHLQSAHSRKDTLSACDAYYRLAVWLQNDNRFREAARAAGRVADLAVRTHSPYWAVYGLLAESHMVWQLAEYTSCADRLDRALRIASVDSVRARFPHAYFSTLQRIGLLQIDLGYPEQALQNLYPASVFFENGRFYFDLSAIYINLAKAYQEIGLLDSAEMYLKKTVRMAPLIPIQPNDRLHAAFVNLAIISARQGHMRQAIDYMKQAILETQRILAEIDESYVQLADFYLKEKNWPDARTSYEKAIQFNSENYLAYCGLARVMESTGNAQNAKRYFDSSAAQAMEVLRKNPGKSVLAGVRNASPVFHEFARFCWRQREPGRTIQLLEQNRGLYSSTLLALADSRRTAPNQWKDRLDTLQRQLQVRRRNSPNPASVLQGILIEAEQSSLLDSIRQPTSPTITVEHIQRQLPTGYAIIQFDVMEDSLLILAITPDTICGSVAAVSRDTLSRWIDDVIKGTNDLIGTSHKLYQLTIDPIESVLSDGVALLVIPDGPLYRLPFEMLVARPASAYRDCEFLIRRHPISYAISLSVLFEQWRKSSVAPRDYIGFTGAGFDTLPDLPGARAQVNFGASMFARSTACEQPDRIRLTKMSAHSRILDFATHTLISDIDPLASEIVFGHTTSVKTADVYDLHLDADLIVLSGCRTGLGKLAAGEGFIGFNQAFSYAGAYSLLMSNRDLDDEATTIILSEFYRQLYEGKSRSKALQQAKIKYILDAYDLKTSPHFWAGLTLWGNPGPIRFSQPPWDLYILAAAVMGLLIGGFRVNRHRR